MISLKPTRSESTSQSPGGESVSLPFGGAGEMAAEAQRRLAGAEETLKTLINDRPALAVGGALALGVILGWLIKRR